ncbi:hypothetical protein O181_109974 [Austropuccinia psidii MF-1]|uniref:Uncharacterized protein n=1 Tax=Austropuccinia psidii MF-1 TaxID=1389203 RepID=A0A9Q3PQE0_9BASI|nr:hypothetical protein [Austropuccinia psidii MF-1]
MSPVYLRDLGFQRNQSEDREGLSRTRRPGRGHLGHSGELGLEGYGSSSSAPSTPQRFVLMEHGQQEVQPGISLVRTWRKLPEYLSQQDRIQIPYGNNQRLTRSRPNQPSSGFTPFRHQQINDQESSLFTIPGGFQEKKRIQGEKQDLFQPKGERVRPHDPEAVGLGKISTQEPEVVVNHSRISSPINRNITPTQTEHNVIIPESNLNRDALWLQMSQYAEHTQTQFAELEASHDRIK